MSDNYVEKMKRLFLNFNAKFFEKKLRKVKNAFISAVLSKTSCFSRRLVVKLAPYDAESTQNFLFFP